MESKRKGYFDESEQDIYKSPIYTLFVLQNIKLHPSSALGVSRCKARDRVTSPNPTSV